MAMRFYRYSAFIILAAAIFFLSVSPALSLQTRNVAVSKVGATSAVLVVKADTDADVRVDYGADPGVYTLSKTGNGLQRHEILLDGFGPAAVVYYQVTITDSANPANIIILPEKNFKTAKAAGLPFSYAVVGDNRPGSNTTVQPAVFSTIMGQMAGEGLDLALHVGDIIYGVGSDTLAQNVARYDGLFAATTQLTVLAPLYAVAGNHERINYANSRAGFEQEFTLPVNNGADAATYGEEYYSFDHGDTHFIMLCTEIPGQEGLITGNQKLWLEQDLAATDKTWIVAGFHRPLFSGIHTGDPWVNTGNTTGQQNKAELHALFRDYGVDVVFAGHDHFYLHHLEDGVHYVITGGAGSPLYGNPPLGSGDIYATSTYHHVKVDETATSLTVSAISSAGATLETFTLTPEPPELTLATDAIYWASYADYLYRRLSVDFTLTNSGMGDAGDLQMVYLVATNGVLPATGVPVSLGRLGNGQSTSTTITYMVPPAVVTFLTKVYVTCRGEDGTTYELPGPAPSG